MRTEVFVYDYHFSEKALSIWVMINQTWTAMRTAEERKLAKTRLTPEKLSVLWALVNHNNPLTPAEISRLLFRTSQTIAGLLARMEKEGLIMRVPKRKGHPFTEIFITDKGRELLRPGAEVSLGIITDIMSSLTDEEQDQLQALMRKLRGAATEELHIEPSPPPGRSPGEVISVEL